MAPEKNNDDDVKLLYACLAFNKSSDIEMEKVAGFMGLSRGAVDKRFSRLKAKLRDTYAGAAGTPPTIASAKGKKRGRKMEEEASPMKMAKGGLKDDDADDDGEREEAKPKDDGK